MNIETKYHTITITRGELSAVLNEVSKANLQLSGKRLVARLRALTVGYLSHSSVDLPLEVYSLLFTL